MRKLFTASVSLVASPALLAANLLVSVQVPNFSVSDGTKSDIALWLEHPDHRLAAQLALWSDATPSTSESFPATAMGLVNLREWWRAGGRDLHLPMDGFSRPAAEPGLQKQVFSSESVPLATLASGRYVLVVEAARGMAGHEVVRLPFFWPPRKAGYSHDQGESELGAVRLTLLP